jgi:ketosteroid isomerase-like protein
MHEHVAPVLSSLDNPSSVFADQPFYDQTVTLLKSVRDHDFATLAALCDDDFGIVDIDVTGAARPIRNRTEWEEWFRTLFATLKGMDAATDSVIRDYKALSQGTLGFGVLEFQQTLTVGSHVASFECVATIIWKLTADGWNEARWHASVISSEVPAALLSHA